MSHAAPRDHEPGATVLVWGAWLAMLVAGTALVVAFGANVPVWDDLGILPVLSGERPADLAWLWSPHNEHRLPLHRLVVLGLMRVSGNDFRVGMLASVVALAVATAYLLDSLRVARGHFRATDAAWPLLLMGPAHHTVFLWCWPLQFALSASLSVVVLAALVRHANGPGLGPQFLAGTSLAALPFTGLTGAALVPGLAVGLLVGAWVSRDRRAVALGLVASLGAMSGAWAVVMAGGAALGAGPRPGVLDVARTATQFLAIGLGRPVSLFGPIGPALASLAFLLACVVLGAAWRRDSDARGRVAGVLGALAGLACLALAVGWGRSVAGPEAGFETRYATLAAPGLVAMVVALDLMAPAALGRIAATLTLCLASLFLWPNAVEALDHGRSSRAGALALLRDVERGTPPHLLIKRHTPYLSPSQRLAAEMLRLLRQGRIGAFAQLASDPAFRATPIGPGEGVSRQAHWEGDTLVVTGVDAAWTVPIEPPRSVRGVRLRYDHEATPAGPARFRLEWLRPGQTQVPAEQTISEWGLPSGEDREVTLWLADTVSELRLRPDNRPCRFRVAEFALLE